MTTKPTGTGLGLPIVKKILDDHGAAIKLKNRSNEETGEILGASVEIVISSLSTRATTQFPTEPQHAYSLDR